MKEFSNLELNVFYINESLFSFEINGVYGEDIFRNPIFYKNNEENYEFIAIEQINWFLKKFSRPMIECKKKNDIINISLLNLKIHLEHGDKIIEYYKYIYYSNEDEYKNFFINHKTEFINIEFNNALDFDKNFNYYFNYKNNLNTKEKFYIYEGKNYNRRFLQMDILKLLNLQMNMISGD